MLRKRRCRTFLPCVLVLSWICGSETVGAETWTIDRTVKRAVETAPSIDMERFDAESAHLDAKNAESTWYPTLHFQSEASVVSEVMELDMPGGSVRFGDYDSYSLKVQVEQLVYDAGRVRAMHRAATHRAEMYDWQAKAQRLSVEFGAKKAFYGLLMANHSREAVRAARGEARQHLAVVEAMKDEGMALSADILQAKLRIGEMDMKLAAAEAECRRSEAAFREVAGLPPSAEVVLAWDAGEPADDVAVPTAGELARRPEFRAFEHAIASSEYAARGERAAKYPHVGMVGGINYGKPGLDMPANEWMHYFSGGLRLEWNLWDWDTADRNAAKALINRDRAKRQRDDFRRRLDALLAEAEAGLYEARARHETAQTNESYAREQLRLVENAYSEGMATETEYDTAHAKFTRATLERAVSRIAVELAAARIEYVRGAGMTGGNDAQ